MQCDLRTKCLRDAVRLIHSKSVRIPRARLGQTHTDSCCRVVQFDVQRRASAGSCKASADDDAKGHCEEDELVWRGVQAPGSNGHDLDVDTRRDRKRKNVIDIRRDDLVALTGEKDERSVDYITCLR